jgi:two-component system, OmpR family, sensor kinase
MPLRIRLTLVYFLLAAVALGSFAVAVYIIASSRIYQNLDEGMTSREQAVASILGTLTQPISQQDIEANRSGLDQEATIGTAFQLRDPGGQLLYSTAGRAGRVELPAMSGPAPNVQSFSTHTVQGRRLRILTTPLTDDNGQTLGILQVAQTLSETDEALNEIRYVLIFGGLTVVFVTGGTAYWLAGRALDPVRRASRLARDIEQTGDFSRRLPADGPRDEMGELASTLNAMISRLEHMLHTQRAFLADSSHELRRPLTVLRTNIDVMKNPDLSPEERQAVLEEMSADATAMSKLVSDLLLLSREVTQAIEQRPVDFSELCRQAIERLRAQDTQHEVGAQVAAEVRVTGDSERLAQMLWNVLENAAQYTPSGGKIDFRLERENGRAQIRLDDTGVGIPDSDLPRVFERFYRSTAARALRTDGMGLGLAIVKYVAEAHGGSVQVESRPGEGTHILIDVPALA